MKKIINTSETDLLFPRLDLHIQSKEIKKVSEDVFNQLIGNMYIKEITNGEEPKVVKSKIIKK